MVTAQTGGLYRLQIEGYSAEGAGVARLDGQAVFVAGALRGETCMVRLTKVGKRAAWGVAERVERPSPARIESDCPYYPRCGGCQLRHMSYEEELFFKRERVQEALRRIGGCDLALDGILGAAETARYRNKAQFPVSASGVGFYRARSHEVIDIDDCLLQPPAAGRIRAAVKAWMARHKVAPYDERTHRGLVRHLFVRMSGAGQSLCCLVINGHSVPAPDRLVALLRAAEPGLVGVLLGENTRKTNVILGERYHTLWGADTLDDALCGLTFRLSVPSFFQVNRAQTEILYAKALEFAAPTGDELALDLYCGVGSITLALARRAGRVIGAEVVAQAVHDARENAARSGIRNAEFLCADAGEAAAALAERGERPDLICVDPPRKGLSPEVIEATVRMGPPRLVYVSCDPATLARDVKELSARGYTPRRAVAVDLFPRTVHVETVVLLSKLKSTTSIEVKIDLDEMDLTKPERKASAG